MRVFQHYDIAYKTKSDCTFRLIEPPAYGWTADPFLVEFQGEVYLFAEIFLYKTERNGVLGYCKYQNGKFTDWTITMDRHWHLSYPNVFVENGKLYMVPESYQLGEVVLYELTAFPDQWRKVKTIISDGEYCDSTFWHDKDGRDYMFTFERGENRPAGKGWLYQMQGYSVVDRQLFREGLSGSRCGGNIFRSNQKLIRVGQNCEQEYGGGLIFYEIESLYPQYKETEMKRVFAEDIVIENSNRRYTGVHTYNRCNELEVVDLKYPSESEEEEMASQRVREVFMNKYR